MTAQIIQFRPKPNPDRERREAELQAQMINMAADMICGIPVYGYGEGIDSIVPSDYDPRK